MFIRKREIELSHHSEHGFCQHEAGDAYLCVKKWHTGQSNFFHSVIENWQCNPVLKKNGPNAAGTTGQRKAGQSPTTNDDTCMTLAGHAARPETSFTEVHDNLLSRILCTMKLNPVVRGCNKYSKHCKLFFRAKLSLCSLLLGVKSVPSGNNRTWNKTARCRHKEKSNHRNSFNTFPETCSFSSFLSYISIKPVTLFFTWNFQHFRSFLLQFSQTRATLCSLETFGKKILQTCKMCSLEVENGSKGCLLLQGHNNAVVRERA